MHRALLFLMAAGCASPAKPVPEPATPEAPVTVEGFAPAVAVSPPEPLLQWLEGEGSELLLRVPVVVTSSPLGLSSAYIAASTATPESDALRITLDDSTMGIPLATHVQAHCPPDAPCAIWVEGLFGDSVAPAPPGPTVDTAMPTLSVRAFVGRVTSPEGFVLRQADPER